ncbi:MAG: hypothetical protein E7497_06965 [Ruminococcus sp.]|nr:hypothetical protein [Ruminococcus sp.]
MKKKIISILLSMTAAVAACSAAAFNTVAADDEIKDKSGFTYRINDKGNAVVTGFTNEATTSLKIPATLGGYTVTHVGDWAFEEFYNLKTVTMADTIVDLGIAAFENCYALQSIDFSDTLNHISVAAFENCRSLTKIILPDTVESIYSSVFDGCTNLREFHVPESLDYFSYNNFNTFSSCPYLEKITFGSKVSLQSYYNETEQAFSTSHMLYIPASVTEITCEEPFTFRNGFTDNGYASNYYFVIAGRKGTEAERFAKEQGIVFMELSDIAEAGDYAALGDVDASDAVDSSDASKILAAYAAIATGEKSPLTAAQSKAADVNLDGTVDSSDASSVLSYYAYAATSGGSAMPIAFYLGIL